MSSTTDSSRRDNWLRGGSGDNYFMCSDSQRMIDYAFDQDCFKMDGS